MGSIINKKFIITSAHCFCNPIVSLLGVIQWFDCQAFKSPPLMLLIFLEVKLGVFSSSCFWCFFEEKNKRGLGAQQADRGKALSFAIH